MNEEFLAALTGALKSISDTQSEILKELKSIKDKQDLVPIVMPDGSVRLVPRENLTARTTDKSLDRGPTMQLVQHEPILKDPWPDPAVPKPKIVR